MYEHNVDIMFSLLTDFLENELRDQRVKAKREAFKPEARPIPDGLIPGGIPLGHIALRGDFDLPPRITHNDGQINHN